MLFRVLLAKKKVEKEKRAMGASDREGAR